ncbi:hypothetical protein [Klebsiella grimontii]|uniref:hypothetical protein n=1 Tax=Klebsiella grimontii TaxID=2058152 RepID=UPI00300C9B13
MITNEIVDNELAILKKVLAYKGLKAPSLWYRFWPSFIVCFWVVFWPFVIFSMKAFFSVPSKEDSLGLFISMVSVCVLGFFSCVLSIKSRSLYLSVPSGFRSHSLMYAFFNSKLRSCVRVFLLCYSFFVVLCSLTPYGLVLFSPITIIAVVVLIRHALNSVNAYKLNAMTSIITSFKSKNMYGTINGEDGYESLRQEEHNPATGLPMVGGVDVGGNPYGYGGHE